MIYIIRRVFPSKWKKSALSFEILFNQFNSAYSTTVILLCFFWNYGYFGMALKNNFKWLQFPIRISRMKISSIFNTSIYLIQKSCPNSRDICIQFIYIVYMYNFLIIFQICTISTIILNHLNINLMEQNFLLLLTATISRDFSPTTIFQWVNL